ncbi:MAG: Hsp33 family molecular chaperone HslO [Yoonia sp.]|mgnify:CR=1 FL=1|uniref:Hsp33 family molecular chaperone HslO n=1 Tax=Yoonia sp. TaxID=2212373 RepID=UPI003267139B
MTIGSIAWDDTVLPFQLDRSDIRGRVARLDGVLEEVLKQHDYPAVIEGLVAEMALLTAMIGQSMKLRWKLSLQVRGEGAARILATDYYAPTDDGQPARIRAYASYNKDTLDENGDGFEQIGKGYFAIMIHQGEDMAPYQGVTPLAGGSLSACAETYFAQSEQLPTQFSLSYGQNQMPGEGPKWRAGGIMLQHMPKSAIRDAPAGDEALREDGLTDPMDFLNEDEGENWNRATALLSTVDDMELIGPTVTPTELLVRLFHEEEPRVFDANQIKFGCTCSEDKVRQSLSIYSAKDIKTMTTPENTVTADCQFCGAHYVFDPLTLGFEAEKAAGDDA